MMDLLSYSLQVVFLILATSGFDRNIESRAQVIDENLRRLATANNDLAVNIYRQITNGSDENVFFSPLSLSTAFGMLYYGTRGDTAEELRTALGYERAGLEEGLVHQTFHKYLTETLSSQDTTAYTLNSANALLLDKQLDLVKDFKTQVQDYYQASVKDVDFATQGPQVVSQINDWVREKTNGKIDQLLEDLDANTLLVLLNAVYFKGTWKTEFNPRKTRPRSFYNNGLRSKRTKTAMMRLVKKFPYAQADGVSVLEMPYKGDNISMLLLLPDELDGLKSLEATLTPTKFSELRSQLVKQVVHTKIPKFKLEYSRELSGDFQSVGARKIFAPTADFSGISTTSMAVSQVLHKAVIEVNEEGSEAAGATQARFYTMSGDSEPDSSFFTVDRPFLFAIIDRRNDMILFLGRVTNL